MEIIRHSRLLITRKKSVDELKSNGSERLLEELIA